MNQQTLGGKLENLQIALVVKLTFFNFSTLDSAKKDERKISSTKNEKIERKTKIEEKIVKLWKYGLLVKHEKEQHMFASSTLEIHYLTLLCFLEECYTWWDI